MAVLLDLDGILANSRPAVAATLRCMLATIGHDPAAAVDLTRAVGSPIGMSIETLLKMYDNDRVAQGLAIYRAHYSNVGLYNCSAYPRMAKMLKQHQPDWNSRADKVAR